MLLRFQNNAIEDDFSVGGNSDLFPPIIFRSHFLLPCALLVLLHAPKPRNLESRVRTRIGGADCDRDPDSVDQIHL